MALSAPSSVRAIGSGGSGASQELGNAKVAKVTTHPSGHRGIMQEKKKVIFKINSSQLHYYFLKIQRLIPIERAILGGLLKEETVSRGTKQTTKKLRPKKRPKKRPGDRTASVIK